MGSLNPRRSHFEKWKKYFSSTFRFKGDPEELKEVEYITFALEQGTQIVNVYDGAMIMIQWEDRENNSIPI
ncbi:hypothetical protein Theco_0127 [Thermobacillus composti KWC4]|jgi:hypothetical protein|uniref:Uncharacterized protein n=1 Tax=Thermobacillus composti (strain DSM 18247 / JCM 13945 / KWC4) TaxID=717605 RepID=L0EB49_THECK|nr:hypothetical protein [Thermobacillus composti]AGA56375.1 hypothetical protein Theco_0127 [Thermobacillus composti KWC4]